MLAAHATAVLAAGRALQPAPLAAGAPTSKIIWMEWEQGEADLRSLNGTDSKYSRDWRCVVGWRRLNPGWEVRLLDAASAPTYAPHYGALVRRNNTDRVHRSDLLRLEVLSRYGGVWADISTCPVRALDAWLPEVLSPTGFFAFWRFPKRDATVDAHCDQDLVTHAAFSIQCANYFMAVSQPQHRLVKGWLDALALRLDALTPGEAAPYWLAGCTLTQLATFVNQTLLADLDAMPHLDPGPLEGKVLPLDTQVDRSKVLYKELGHHGLSDSTYYAWVSGGAWADAAHGGR